MSILMSLIGNKVSGTLIAILLTWGVTAGKNWWDNREERLIQEAALTSVVNHYSALVEIQSKTDQLITSSEKQKREKNIEYQNEAGKNEVACVDWVSGPAPDACVERMQYFYNQRQDTNRNKSSDHTARDFFTRLRNTVIPE